MPTMDRIDKKILNILQTNSDISNQDLADNVALSASPCLRRVKQLEEEGHIKNYVALLNPYKLGLKLTVLILVKLKSHDPAIMKKFEKSVKSLSEVIQCDMIMGQKADYLLKVIVPEMSDYQSFLLEKLTRIDGVTNVESSVILKNIVDTTALPLDHICNG